MLMDLNQDINSWHCCHSPRCSNNAVGAFRALVPIEIDDESRSALDIRVKLCQECISKIYSNMREIVGQKK